MAEQNIADKGSHVSPDEERELLGWIKQQGKQFKKRLNILVLLGVMIFAIKVGAMWLLASLLSDIIIARSPLESSAIAPLMLCFVAQSMLVFSKNSYQASTEKRINLHYFATLESELNQQSLALIRQYPIANWQSFFLERIPALASFYTDYQVQKTIASLVPILVTAVVFSISWLIGLILIISAPLIPFFMWIMGMGAATAHRHHFTAIDRLNHMFLDRLRGQQVLYLFDRSSTEYKRFKRASVELKHRTMKVVRIAFMSATVLDFLSTVAMALVAVLVGFSLLGEVRFGSWEQGLDFQHGLFLLLMTPLFFAELKLLGRFYHTKSEAIGAAHELHSIIDSPAHVFDTFDAHLKALKIPKSTIYDRHGESILENQSLRILAGDKVIIQGASGSGKSVMLEALLGLRPIQPRNPDSEFVAFKREDVSWLGQQAVIRADSIRDNLTLGCAFSDDQIWQVLERVDMRNWVAELPGQLHFKLGEKPPISGGQAQRLALARVLLFDKPIVMLDEPTAHLTHDQHLRLSALLQTTLADKTVIWVTHKPVDDAWFSQRWQIDKNACVVPVSNKGRS